MREVNEKESLFIVVVFFVLVSLSLDSRVTVMM